MSIETGFWILYGVEEGHFQPTYLPEKRLPAEQFLRAQGRFSRMNEEEISEYRNGIDREFQSVIDWPNKDGLFMLTFRKGENR
jgi:pyruvate ferredoxin oxidoreductase beta subunit